MEHLNDLIGAAGVIGVPALAAATIALAIRGCRRGARLVRQYVGVDVDTVLDQVASQKAAAEKAAAEKAGV